MPTGMLATEMCKQQRWYALGRCNRRETRLELGDERLEVPPAQALAEGGHHARELAGALLEPGDALRLHVERLRAVLHRHLPCAT